MQTPESCVPGRIRTCDRWVKSPPLYRAELQGQGPLRGGRSEHALKLGEELRAVEHDVVGHKCRESQSYGDGCRECILHSSFTNL